MREEKELVLSPRHSANSFQRRWKWCETTTLTAVISCGIPCASRACLRRTLFRGEIPARALPSRNPRPFFPPASHRGAPNLSFQVAEPRRCSPSVATDPALYAVAGPALYAGVSFSWPVRSLPIVRRLPPPFAQVPVRQPQVVSLPEPSRWSQGKRWRQAQDGAAPPQLRGPVLALLAMTSSMCRQQHRPVRPLLQSCKQCLL
jgi:hypothetical protein